VTQAKVEPQAAAATGAIVRHSSQYLVGRNNTWENAEEGVHNEHRYERGLRKFQHTAVVSNRTHKIWIDVMKWCQPDTRV